MTAAVRSTQTQQTTRVVAMLLFNNSSIGGAERRYAWIYQELRRRHVPILLAINESLLHKLQRSGAFPQHQAPDFILKERIGRMTRGLRKLDYVLGLVPLTLWIWRRRPQVLHLVLGGAYLALPMQAIGAAPPAVLSVVCPNLRELVGSSGGLYLYRLALRFAAHVDALTESVRRMVVSEGVAAERIHVPGGSCVDTQRFRPDKKEPWVVFCGRLVPDKDPRLFVEACAMVRDRMKDRAPNLRMFMLGDGPLRREIEVLVQREKLGPWMHLGWSEHVESVLSRAAVFVSLQRTDNYPSQALLEAMASGTAVVATDVGLTGKLIDDEVGCLVPSDRKAVAEAIIGFLENPSHAVDMGRRARARVIQHHSIEPYLGYIQNVYAEIT